MSKQKLKFGSRPDRPPSRETHADLERELAFTEVCRRIDRREITLAQGVQRLRQVYRSAEARARARQAQENK